MKKSVGPDQINKMIDLVPGSTTKRHHVTKNICFSRDSDDCSIIDSSNEHFVINQNNLAFRK